jgi:ELWxxDGT repeat protein
MINLRNEKRKTRNYKPLPFDNPASPLHKSFFAGSHHSVTLLLKTNIMSTWKTISLFHFLFFPAVLFAQVTATVVKEIRPGGFGGEPRFVTVVNNIMFFSADDGPNGRELWKSDGTEAGTVMVKDIRPGSGDSDPTSLEALNGILLFGANNGVNGWELWRSDGTDAGTYMVRDIQPGFGSSEADNLVEMNGYVYFSAETSGLGSTGRELWRSDGTLAGTTLVKDIIPGSGSGNPGLACNVNGTLFFSAFNGFNGGALWKSDGTTAGTDTVKDVPFALNPSIITSFNNQAYFEGKDPVLGPSLWKSDGTEAGTSMVIDITPGGSGGPKYMLAIGNILYITCSDGTTGDELWRSDGTAAGTTLVKDIHPGNLSSTPTEMANINGILYFQANHPAYGQELWRSDGTEQGTELVLDLYPDVSSSIPRNINIVNGVIYFTPSTEESGWELFRLENIIVPVKWLDFKSIMRANKQVELVWKTSNEINNRHFEVQHAADGSMFNTIAIVPAKPNTAGINEYSFMHVAPVSGKNYYRLKQVDENGRYEYSKIVYAELNNSSDKLRVYPNPVLTNTVTIAGIEWINESATINLLGEDGKLIRRYTIMQQVSTPLQLSLPESLKSGNYFLSISNGGFNTLKKITVLR